MSESNEDSITTTNNPIRERMKKRNPADFSSSTLRRVAFTQLSRKR
ncbi:hypothetical protein [Bacillus sinesaloumensis]|nr:hypothetical protein [Bacillus sinesaloumensis]